MGEINTLVGQTPLYCHVLCDTYILAKSVQNNLHLMKYETAIWLKVIDHLGGRLSRQTCVRPEVLHLA